MRTRWTLAVAALALLVAALWVRAADAPPSADRPPPATPTSVAGPAPAPPERRPPLVADYGDMQERMATTRADVEGRLGYFHDQPWYREVGR